MPHRPYYPGRRDRQTVREIQNSTPRYAHKKISEPVADSAPLSQPLETKQLLDKIFTLVETACPSTQSTSSDLTRGQNCTGPGHYSDFRCCFCSNTDHFKRECPFLQNSQQMQPKQVSKTVKGTSSRWPTESQTADV